MRISHKYKFIYIALPKTGSSSVRKALDIYSDIRSKEADHEPPYGIHTSVSELKPHFDKMEWDWNDYFKFTIVRNPWSRLVSNYNYKMKSKYMWETYKKGNSTHYKECVKFAEKFKNFKNYVMSDGRELLTPLTWYIGDHSGNILIDYAGKNENLQNDFDTICDKIGIPKQKLPYKNKSKHKHCLKTNHP